MPHTPDIHPEDDEQVTTEAPQRRGALARRWAAVRATGEAGMSTAEYAVGTIAAVGFAGVLFKVVTSSKVQAALSGLIEKALH